MTSITEQFGELKSNVTDGKGPANIRSTPSTKAETNIVSKQPLGTRVKILDKTSAEGRTWYKVSYGKQQKDVGWVREDVIKLLPNQTPSKPSQNPDNEDTRLYFETDKRLVRVYEESAKIYMNVYNKKTNQTELSGVSATKLTKDLKTAWEGYLATKDGRTYQAFFINRGATQLIITSSDTAKNIEPTETGFGAKGIEYQQIA
ncbi:MAG: SH3 domain-containing protein [Gloeotrichia echinulata GP01]